MNVEAAGPMGFVVERDREALTGCQVIQPRELHLYVIPHPWRDRCACGKPIFRVVSFHDPEEERKYYEDASKTCRDPDAYLSACLSMGRLVE